MSRDSWYVGTLCNRKLPGVDNLFTVAPLGAVITTIQTTTWADIVVNGGNTQTFYFPRIATVVTTIGAAPIPTPFLNAHRDGIVARQIVPGQDPALLPPTPESFSTSSVQVPLSTGALQAAPTTVLEPIDPICASEGVVGNFSLNVSTCSTASDVINGY